MLSAPLLASVSAFLFGAMTVALRLALRKGADVLDGALATVAVGLLVALSAVAIRAAAGSPLHVSETWPFMLAGVLAPGGSQLLFTVAVRDAGASRSAVILGTAPLLSLVLALSLLGEPLRPLLVVGAGLVVAGGVVIGAERIGPETVRKAGIAYAFGAAFLFASRDSFVRWLSERSEVQPVTAAAVTLTVGMAVLALANPAGIRRIGRPEVLAPFVPVGILFGLSYLALFAAYYRGAVTVVSPLVACEALWGVAFAAILLRGSERVGRQLVAGAVLVVAGGAIIGAFSE